MRKQGWVMEAVTVPLQVIMHDIQQEAQLP